MKTGNFFAGLATISFSSYMITVGLLRS